MVGDIKSGDTFTVEFAYTANSGRTFEIEVVSANKKTDYGSSEGGGGGGGGFSEARAVYTVFPPFLALALSRWI